MKNALKRVIIAKVSSQAFIILFLLSQGCCTTPPAIPHTYHRPLTEFQKQEDKIVEIMRGLYIVRRRQNHLLNPALGPVPEAVFDQAKQARELVFSDEDYTKALSSFEEALSRRLRALAAEEDVYQAWLTGDRFTPHQKSPDQ